MESRSCFDNKILDHLRIIAEDVPAVNSSRICAAIVHHKKIVSIGINSRKTDTWAARFSKNPLATCIHAEVAAIKAAVNRIGKDALKDCSIYISRRKLINGKWVDGLAKPCSGCQKAIDFFDIKKVVYTYE